MNLTGTVNENAIGRVSVVVSDNHGDASINSSILLVGWYLVNVIYLGDEYFLESSNSTYFNLTKADLKANVSALNITVECFKRFQM